MRKSRHFIKKLTKKINVYIVVFVALVNACFYCPEVHAADSYSVSDCFDIALNGRYLFSGAGGYPVIDSDILNYPATYVSTALYPDSTYFSSTYDFYVPLQFRFSLPDDFSDSHISGYLGFDFIFYLNCSSSTPEYSDLQMDIYSTDAPDGVHIGGYPSVYNGSGNIIGVHMWLTVDFDNVNFTKDTRFNVYLHVTASSMTYGVNTSGLFYLKDPNFDSGTALVYPGLAPDSQNNYIANGYDSSAGNQVASDLGNSASGYESAEDSIFTSSQSSLEGFEFFDFNSIPAVVTGLSFITTTATAIFDAMGGTSGAGIVLSVLFAVMFVSIVIGLYRYFK